MFRKIINTIITKIKGENFTLDEQVPIGIYVH